MSTVTTLLICGLHKCFKWHLVKACFKFELGSCFLFYEKKRHQPNKTTAPALTHFKWSHHILLNWQDFGRYVLLMWSVPGGKESKEFAYFRFYVVYLNPAICQWVCRSNVNIIFTLIWDFVNITFVMYKPRHKLTPDTFQKVKLILSRLFWQIWVFKIKLKATI